MTKTPLYFEKSQVKTLIFDWDGTLLNSIGALSDTFFQTCKTLSLPAPSLEALQNSFGNPSDSIVQGFFPDNCHKDPHFLETFKQTFRQGYHKSKPQLFTHSKATLTRLHKLGYTLCVATNKNRLNFDQELQQTGLEHLITLSKTPTECPAKPDPSMLHSICNTLAVLPENCIMIGDHSNDIVAAHEANMPAVILLQNHKNTPNTFSSLNPEGILAGIEDLPDWLRNKPLS